MSKRGLKEFTDAYIEAALWSSTDENGVPLDRDYSRRDLTPDALRQMEQDARIFYGWYRSLIEKAGIDVPYTPEGKAGHDFWLTRNGHGAGFWDGDWPEKIGELLTEASHGFGESTLFVGENGEIDTIEVSGKPKRVHFEGERHPGDEGGVLDWAPPKKPRKPKK